MSCVKFVLVLSLGAVSTGCGYLWRTIPSGYYDTDPRTRGDKVYETDKYGNVRARRQLLSGKNDTEAGRPSAERAATVPGSLVLSGAREGSWG